MIAANFVAVTVHGKKQLLNLALAEIHIRKR
jgi:hypothetical protein